jgi:hypothetical protein
MKSYEIASGAARPRNDGKEMTLAMTGLKASPH